MFSLNISVYFHQQILILVKIGREKAHNM